MPIKGPPCRGYPLEGMTTAGHPPRGCPREMGSPRMPARRTGLKAARGQDWHLRGPTGASLGRNHQGKWKGERRAGQAEAAARRLRTCGPGATREDRADREDLKVKRRQIVKKVIVRCPIY